MMGLTLISGLTLRPGFLMEATSLIVELGWTKWDLYQELTKEFQRHQETELQLS